MTSIPDCISLAELSNLWIQKTLQNMQLGATLDDATDDVEPIEGTPEISTSDSSDEELR